MRSVLCTSAELAENGEKGISLYHADEQIVLLIRREGQVYAYRNHCPHTGVELNWQPDQFLDNEGFYIQCSVHGAKFEVETGLCVSGPCADQSLLPVSVEEVDGNICTSESLQEF